MISYIQTLKYEEDADREYNRILEDNKHTKQNKYTLDFRNANTSTRFKNRLINLTHKAENNNITINVLWKE